MEYLYFDRHFNDQQRSLDHSSPHLRQNRLIYVTGTRVKFSCLMADSILVWIHLKKARPSPAGFIVKMKLQAKIVREDNITAHALDRFRTVYQDGGISRNDIFH